MLIDEGAKYFCRSKEIKPPSGGLILSTNPGDLWAGRDSNSRPTQSETHLALLSTRDTQSLQALRYRVSFELIKERISP